LQTNRSEPFIKRDFGFYDSGILGCLNPIVFNIYEILRRYVWRSSESGDPDWRRMYRNNQLAATVSQAEIGEIVDRGKDIVNTHIGTAKDLGWVKVIQDPEARRPATYVLGERVRDSQGRYHEVFYADAWMQDLWQKLHDAANEGSDEPEKVSSLPWERRREICRDWMAETKQASPRAKPHGKSNESDNVVKDPTSRNSPDTLSSSTEECSNVVSSPSGVGISKLVILENSNLTYGTGLEKSETRIAKSLQDKNREILNTYRPASERGIGHFDQPRKKKQFAQSPEGRNSQYPTTSQLNKKTAETRSKSTNSAPEGLEDQFSESSASSIEKSSNVDGLSAGISDTAARFALLSAVAAGTTPAPLDATGETYRERVSRARARQVEQSAARDAKLRNFDGSKPHEVRQALKHLEGVWAAECRARYGDAAGAWQVQDRKMVEGLLKSYKLDLIISAMKYLAGAWPGLNKRLFKGNGGMVPTIGVLSRCHATLVPESADYSELASLADEYNNWWKQNPNDFPPDDLQNRYNAHSQKLKALGLVNP
jgi:hypothetical protein